MGGTLLEAEQIIQLNALATELERLDNAQKICALMVSGSTKVLRFPGDVRGRGTNAGKCSPSVRINTNSVNTESTIEVTTEAMDRIIAV